MAKSINEGRNMPSTPCYWLFHRIRMKKQRRRLRRPDGEKPRKTSTLYVCLPLTCTQYLIIWGTVCGAKHFTTLLVPGIEASTNRGRSQVITVPTRLTYDMKKIRLADAYFLYAVIRSKNGTVEASVSWAIIKNIIAQGPAMKEELTYYEDLLTHTILDNDQWDVGKTKALPVSLTTIPKLAKSVRSLPWHQDTQSSLTSTYYEWWHCDGYCVIK